MLSTETGYSRDYQRYPYGDYRTNNFFLLFPVDHEDDRLPQKARVHGVLSEGETRVFPLTAFSDSVSLIQEVFGDRSLVVAGNENDNFVVSYFNELEEGDSLSFVPVQDQYPVIMSDQEGNSWDVFGNAVAGPREGARLTHARSFMGYWFSFVAFYPGLSLYEP